MDVVTKNQIPDARVWALDGLRGIALVMMLVIHAREAVSYIPVDWIRFLIKKFWISIDIFFVLSGFLITAILLAARERPRYFRNFYVRRALRIFPAYYVTLLILLLATYLFDPQYLGRVLEDMPRHVVFLQNWWVALYGAESFGYGLTHTWSMGVEEQFYLLWPVLIWFTPASRVQHLCILVIVAVLSLKILLWTLAVPGLNAYVWTPARMDALAAGALIATLRPSQIEKLIPLGQWVFYGGLLSLAIFSQINLGTLHKSFTEFFWGTSLTILTTTTLIFLIKAGTLHRVWRVLLEIKLLQWLGKHSYSIYLLHVPFLLIARSQMLKYLESLGIFGAHVALAHELLIYALAILLGYLMSRFIEKPALDLRHRLAPN